MILENAPYFEVEDDLLEQIFDCMIRDMSASALEIYSKTSSTKHQKSLALDIIKAPVANKARFDRVWQEHVFALKGVYDTGL